MIEQLHKIARESHEKIVGRVASHNLPKLDRLQARTLHGEPFGHRCVRNQNNSDELDDDDDDNDDDDDDDDSGGDSGGDGACEDKGEAKEVLE